MAQQFAELGREWLVDGRPGGAFRVLTEAAVRVVPGAQYAGITQGHPGLFETVAPTDELVDTVDGIQYELASGPCVDAIVHETVFNAGDLREDPRWPEFGRRAFQATGIISMLSFRLFVEDERGLIAGMNLYSRVPGAFDERSEAIGLLLATHGALAVTAAVAQEKAATWSRRWRTAVRSVSRSAC